MFASRDYHGSFRFVEVGRVIDMNAPDSTSGGHSLSHSVCATQGVSGNMHSKRTEKACPVNILHHLVKVIQLS